jgi:prepilin-type N-terminal cleavage/methylation domain-containing protein
MPCARSRQDGFTLLEVLAALAIASVILMATAALIHNVALYFDRGTQGVSDAERVILGVERLAADFDTTRFIVQKTPKGVATAFIGTPEKVVFVAASNTNRILQDEEASGGEEIITLTIEREGELSRLIRRRAAWHGARTGLEDVTPQDAVLLIQGRFDASFGFAKSAPDGRISWSNSWIGQPALPRLVRLNLIDRATGTDLLAGNEFVIHSDASPACALPNARTACFAATALARDQAADSAHEDSSP